MQVVTRFAPSPTGYLHIGGARTALFSWLYAKQKNGSFVLRIEDTDRERSTEESVQAILDGMSWLGLDYDKGPFFQTDRFDRYAEVIDILLSTGHAYRCTCSKERLQAVREGQLANKLKPRYDGACRERNLSSEVDQPFVVRFKNPETGDVLIEDMIKGQISVNNDQLDDLILARTDGSPTYNLTVVVDDADMGITDVIRGDDHLNNTPRQINLFNAIGLTPPNFAHVPMILGADSKRLSKRHGAVSVLQYREEGYLPEALLNYLIRLGWSFGDQEIFSVAEMIEHFNFSSVSRAPAAFNPEKLLWLNQHYLKTMAATEIATRLKPYVKARGLDISQGPDLCEVVMAFRDRVKTLIEMAESCEFLYRQPARYEDKAVKHLKDPAGSVFQALIEHFSVVSDWQETTIHAVVVKVSEFLELKMGKVAQPIRVAVTGSTVSPSIDVTLSLLGRDETLRRLQRAYEYTQTVLSN